MTIEIYNNVIAALRNIIKDTEYEGHVYSVGGCCRDILLGMETIKDVDLVVSLPDGGIKFANWLADKHLLAGSVVAYPTYGTSMFKLAEFPDIELEAVQTRSEEYINRDSRKPSTSFGSIKEDCMRRDLTINAIYYNISDGEFLDVCGTSMDDLKKQIIRTPCDPDITYTDDPLRIMRCVRFACRYGWQIDKDVYAAMKRNIDRLEIISKERINDEFTKICASKHPMDGFRMLNEIGASKYIFNFDLPAFYNNELFTKMNYNSQLTIILWYYINQSKSRGIKLSEFVNASLSVLKYSNDVIKTVTHYLDIAIHSADVMLEHEADKVFCRWFTYSCKSYAAAQDIADIIRVFCGDAMYEHLQDIIENDDYFRFFGYKLAVNGDDVMRMGVKQGPAVNVYLQVVLHYAFMTGKIDRDSLLNYLQTYTNSEKK